MGALPEGVEIGVVEEDVGVAGPEGAGPKTSKPRAVDATVDEEDRLAGVEEQGGAGGEFAVDEDEIAGLAFLVDGLS